MQQWECHIQGLENVFGAREVEKIGRQIDGVEDLSVDYAGETLFLKADSKDVLKRLERVLALSGYKLVKKGYYVTSVILVPDLESINAQEIVRKTIGAHTQVRKLELRPLSKLIYLTHDIDFSISRFICDLNNQQVTAHLRNQNHPKNRWQTFANFSVLLSAIIFLAAVLIENFYHASTGTFVCYVSSLVISGILLTKRAFTQLILHRKLTYSLLMLVASLILIVENLWFEASLLSLSLAASFMFEERSSWKLKEQWSLLRSMLPLFGFVQKGDDREALPVERISVDDVLVIQSGEYVPLDGEIKQGQGLFSASNIIAGSDTFSLSEKDKVFAGLQLLEGSIEMRVTSSANSSALNLLLKRLENLQTQITGKQQKIAKKLDYLLYGLLVVASVLIAMQYMPSPILSDIWLEKGLALLVIAGSAFVLTSIQFSHLFTYLYAAKNGLYFFNPTIWEELVCRNTMVVDKTGVITNNQPEVQEVSSLTHYSTNEILRLAASLAVVSENKRFQPLVARAKNSDVELLSNISINKSSSKYISATVKSSILTLGSQSTMANDGLLNKEILGKIQRWQAEGENVLFLADEKNVLGMITVLDKVRDETGEFIDYCHNLGFENIILMSNDNEGASKIVANRYGFDEVVSDLSEDEKLSQLVQISKQNNIISVSDNPAVCADDGVAILSNALKSTQVGEENKIVSLGKNILPIAHLFKAAQKLQSRTNRLVTLLLNVKLIVLGLIVANLVSLGNVIMIEFLLATWVLSSTYRPKDMFVEIKQ